MRIRELHLTAFGPFTERVLDFGKDGQELVFIHGRNEAGKSSTLRAITDLRYGIHPQSKDNFVHQHRDMRIGALLLDHADVAHTVVRRKGNKATLTFANGDPVPPDVEARITCGLSKEEYESMFGLDHERLRAGGEALLAGEGDIGAALFEASAGVRSIAAVLERLDQTAREFYIPKGRVSRLNEAIRDYSQHRSAYTNAQVKPAQWGDLFKRQQHAQEKVAALESRQQQLHASLRRVTELRAVAPLLRTIDIAQATLDELGGHSLLDENAPTERAGAQAGLAAAEHNAATAAAQMEEARRKLDTLLPERPVLAAAAGIDRLSASVENLDRYRRERDDANGDLIHAQATLAAQAKAIAPGETVERLQQLAPKAGARAEIVKMLHSAETARQRLEDHQLSASSTHDDDRPQERALLPDAAVRQALQLAREAVVRQEGTLKRAARLPGEINSARRTLDATLKLLGIAAIDDLLAIRPLFDGEIDDAKAAFDQGETRKADLEKRIAEIAVALRTNQDMREQLLTDGAVPTADDVAAARAQRDQTVARMRIAGTAASHDAEGTEPLDVTSWQTLADEIRHADTLVDSLARDAKRATQLQACLRKIADLERDRDMLVKERQAIEARQQQEQQAWQGLLAQRQLAQLPPAALREWQNLLNQARTQKEALDLLDDEQRQVADTEKLLANGLRKALGEVSEVHGGIDADGGLDELLAHVDAMEKEFARLEKASATAAGKRAERQEQRAQFASREKQLTEALERARTDLAAACTQLLQPANASVAEAMARLDDFDALNDAVARRDAAQLKLDRASHAIAALEQQANALAHAIGDAEPADIRLYAEQLHTRLEQARSVATARTVVEKAIEQHVAALREHQESIAAHQRKLAALCAAANVQLADALPHAEELSRRKRDAQGMIDRARANLALASSRTEQTLRELLASCDVDCLDADEQSYQQELAQLEAQVRAARTVEETARRELEAVDASDVVIAERQQMERASAAIASALPSWVRARLAHSLLDEALRRFREKAQGPMLLAASHYFQCMTDGQFVRLVSDDNTEGRPTLLAQRGGGALVGVEGMSEGTRDQLYLALRLAALDLRREAGLALPVVLDDVLITSDDARARHVLGALSQFAKGHQVILFTHHAHLLGVAESCLPPRQLAVVAL
ncbi:ATP-binding protein [Noviherbaspirillum galbum]|uniref:AAA family ATPase n=1 Tax=Noviherbaspirillum galbum TaxID=2709383 RepID=A0A6B3SYH7_9BURK|nr:YhaN family protein [Noviherbaspirillum galbum]NEX64845.1 AAA family ATPase [Noviherbaspirillum galbum]